ncbi:MAG: 1-acyl-sn-glycerol-3-phosphate acyltransferase [Bacteroidales bacterium]|nr:1-acyl-sn-glycerol-3-phosphate acyltransferase [Bacteroidales bacterium]
MSANKKPTLQEKLSCRKYHKPRGIIMFLYRHIMSGFVAPKYRPHYVRHVNINDCKGPCFVIWNHLSRLDHAFVMEATYPRKLSIVAGYNEFFRSHLALVFRLMNVIPKKNYNEDIAGVRAMWSIIKQGGCIAFSPEGMSSIYGQNQPIVPGTGRFLKSFGIPVYFVHLSGSYLTSTKVCTDIRPGRVDVELSLLFSPEQLEAMSGDEIQDAINAAFRHDDYAWNKEKRIRYKSRGKICTKLDDICYKCPKCGAELQMTSGGDTIRCEACGNGARMNDYYDFEPFNQDCVLPESPNKWVEMERKDIIGEIRRNPEYSFTEKVKVGCLPTNHLVRHKKTSEPCGEGCLTIDHSGLHFSGTKFGAPWNWELGYDVVYSLPIVTDTSFFSLYIDREYHDIFPERHSVGKMLLLTEEMHRLHVNTWKNFPWCDHLYQK